ncbi:BZ3501_MvSof-1269-A2-R1_C27g00004 [Microbotryum saponariae]|nr:BZ3501_MvSof-1269-A2-R1_C27g00004 [Microbotryum saponariae]
MTLWREALRYVVDTKNLSPHSAIDHKIPDTIWYGKPPSTANLRAFGCRAWHTTWQATSSSEDVDYTRRRGSGRRKVDWAGAGDRGTTEEGTRL